MTRRTLTAEPPMPDQPDTEPRCAVCDKRPPADGYQTCTPCQAGLDADLAAIPDLAQLLPAAVAPSLAQPLTIGARSTDTPMPGGEALNLTAGSSDEVPIRYVPHVRTVRDVTLVEVPGYRPIEHSEWRREPVVDEQGRPQWIPDGDQHGDLGPWVMVGRWVEDWAALRGVGETGVPGVGWLRERLDWACRDHPDLPGWAAELRAMVGGMRALLAVKARVVRYANRCPDDRCNAPASLFRIIDPMLDPDDHRTRYINCGVCGRMYDLDDDRIGRAA